MTDKIIGIGPFFGDFRAEILFMRPFVSWMQEYMEYDFIFINTHFNRQFLYDPEIVNFPIYEHLTRHEFSQKGLMHRDVNNKDFQLLKKKFKKNVAAYCNMKKTSPIMYNLPYQPINKIELHQRHFKEILFNPIELPEDDFILFIPEYQENIKINLMIYEKLSKNYNVIVAGDLKIHLPEHNVVIEKKDYVRNCYKYILSYMKKAKCIICPASHWTALANLQKYPVFSWSKTPGIYKDFYNFDNEKGKTIYYSRENDVEILYKSIQTFIENV